MMNLLLTILMIGTLASGNRRLVETESADGRVHAVWSVSPAEPQLSDTILLTLEVEADSTLHVEMPEFGSMLGELEIVRKTERTFGITADRESKQFVLHVIPERNGITPIWQTTIRYSDQREELREKSYLLTLPTAELEIKSAVTPESASLDNLSSSPSIFEFRSINFLWIILAVIVVALISLFFLHRFFRKPATVSLKPDLTPQEIALQRLTLLIAGRSYETDVKNFFIELTGIVRWYIEQQTNLRAPELTTEEFLHEITQQWEHRSVLPLELRDRLQLFLESADMVKFARFQPPPDEIMLGIRRAEEFISQFAPKIIVREIQS
ncbi:MAG: hypothetical protein LBU34_01435 [Planctomycetaceae bacterium]|jgi:hypothetical protein|nr:hypothetical protein [Planctomycetaceae bacterium]